MQPGPANSCTYSAPAVTRLAKSSIGARMRSKLTPPTTVATYSWSLTSRPSARITAMPTDMGMVQARAQGMRSSSSLMTDHHGRPKRAISLVASLRASVPMKTTTKMHWAARKGIATSVHR